MSILSEWAEGSMSALRIVMTPPDEGDQCSYVLFAKSREKSICASQDSMETGGPASSWLVGSHENVSEKVMPAWHGKADMPTLPPIDHPALPGDRGVRQ